jgi:DNA-binding NarL/FixJ family response regulator
MLSKVIIIEDELFVVMQLSKLINSLGYKVVGTYHSGEDFLAETDWDFEIALVDIFLAERLTGIEVAEVLKKKQKPFIFLTANQDTKTIHKAAALAPEAYLSKPFQVVEVEAALTILKLKNSSTSIDPFYLFLKENDNTNLPLTLREVEVLKTLTHGSSNDIVAKNLFISKNTLKTHLRNLYKKFGVIDRKGLAQKMKLIFK